ncbi:MAG: SDR family oxidoreductase [Moraxellaceae bacterium]|nr:MAG: SDR family oxidoreductase [Moraxellaceae bacterium]
MNPSTEIPAAPSSRPDIVLVTGAAQGIGAAICLKLLSQGKHIVGIDCQPDPQQWPIWQALTDQFQPLWHPLVLDLTSLPAISAFFSEHPLLQNSSIEALVNAAGILRMGTLLDATLQDWQTSLQVNLMAPVLMSQATAQRMVQQKFGTIVTVSSNAARVPRQHMGIYATTKAALSHFCRNLALELAEHGIRCNVVSPGSTLTPMQKQLWPDDQPPASILQGNLAQYRTGIPLQQMAQPDDIANAVLFLLSDQARQITLHEMVVDGGATLGA